MSMAGRSVCTLGGAGVPEFLASRGLSVKGIAVGCQPFLPIWILERSTLVPSSALFQSMLNVTDPPDVKLNPFTPPASCASIRFEPPWTTDEGRNCVPPRMNMSMRPSLLKSAMIESAVLATVRKFPLGAELSNSVDHGQVRVL